MNVAVYLNSNNVKYAIVMLTSFCENNPERNAIFVFYSELRQEEFELIEKALNKYDLKMFYLNVAQDLDGVLIPSVEKPSFETYYRLLLLDKLPAEVDRVFCLDIDIIVHGTLKELYYSDFEGADLMACEDRKKSSNIHIEKGIEMQMPLNSLECKCFDVGVMLLNVEQMRNKYSLDKYLEVVEKWNSQIPAIDQHILNYVHYGKVKLISWEEYDLFAREAYNSGWKYDDVKEKNKIIHFTGEKPWRFDNVHFEIESFWWEYASLTLIYKELLEDFLEYALTSSFIENEVKKLRKNNDEFTESINEALRVLEKFKT